MSDDRIIYLYVESPTVRTTVDEIWPDGAPDDITEDDIADKVLSDGLDEWFGSAA